MKIQITFRDTADNDLIEWYHNAPYGDRNYIIREALREYLKNKEKPSRTKPSRNTPSNALRNLEL